MNYGYTFKERFISSFKRFFIKTFLLLFVLVSVVVYFFYSDFGNSILLIKDFKEHTNQQIYHFYDTQTTEFSNAFRKDLGLQPVSSQKPVSSEEESHKTTTPSSDTPKETTNEITNRSNLPIYKIPFYYDHSNAPSGVSKEDSLKILQQASQQWTDACGITFEYKGDKLADYVNNKNVINGKIGIIKWETQMEGSAIGEAHLGNSRGPASGFVLALFSEFFASHKSELVNTIVHEMGHVIGLNHSVNRNSLMFPIESQASTLQESDKAMCRYFRYRWVGMNHNSAQNKAGILSNGGAGPTTLDFEDED